MSPHTLDLESAFDEADSDAFRWRPDASNADTFEAGERICPPSRGAPRGTVLPSVLVLAGLGCAAWSFAAYPDVWRQARDGLAAGLVLLQTPPRIATAPTPAPVSVPEPDNAGPPVPLPERAVAGAPGQQTGLPVPVPAAVTAAAPAEPAPSAGEAEPTASAEPTAVAADKPQVLPKPVADPANPQQQRALAAGLHPDLSKAVLARLTSSDFRNARFAISKALAETADGETFAWPERRKASAPRAEFEVRFVAGAARDCRRYVVTVTLDRWSTTAPAMETCGADLPKARAAPRRRAEAGGAFA